jgi:hypothetical protein
MASFDFGKFLSAFREGMVELATKEGKEYIDEARKDGDQFATDLRADLELWGRQLASGALSQADFASLLRGRRDVAEMAALKQVGLAKVRIDRIVDGMIDVAVMAAKGAAA